MTSLDKEGAADPKDLSEPDVSRCSITYCTNTTMLEPFCPNGHLICIVCFANLLDEASESLYVDDFMEEDVPLFDAKKTFLKLPCPLCRDSSYDDRPSRCLLLRTIVLLHATFNRLQAQTKISGYEASVIQDSTALLASLNILRDAQVFLLEKVAGWKKSLQIPLKDLLERPE